MKHRAPGKLQRFQSSAFREAKKSTPLLQLGTQCPFLKRRFAATADVSAQMPLCELQDSLSGAAQTGAAGGAERPPVLMGDQE